MPEEKYEAKIISLNPCPLCGKNHRMMIYPIPSVTAIDAEYKLGNAVAEWLQKAQISGQHEYGYCENELGFISFDKN